MRTLLLTIFTFCTIWLSAQQAELVTQQKDLGTITFIDYSSDGKLIVSGSAKDNLVKVWDVKSGKVLGTLSGHEGTTSMVKFVGDDNFVISSDLKGKTILWDLKTWSLKDTLNHNLSLFSAASINGSSQLVFGDKKGGVYLSDYKNFRIGTKVAQLKGAVSCLNYNVKRNVLVAGSRLGQVFVWDAITKKKKISNKLFSSDVVGIEFFNNDSEVLFISQKGRLSLFSFQTKKKLTESSLNISSITAIAVHENTIAVSGSNHKIKIYDFNSKKVINEIKNENLNESKKYVEPIRKLVFSPDGSVIAGSSFRRGGLGMAKSSENVIKLWNVEKGTLYKSMKGEVDPLLTFCFHPTENRLITLSDKRELTFWNLNTAEIVDTSRLRTPKLEPRIKEIAKDPNAVKETVGGFLRGGFSLSSLKKPAASMAKKIIKRAIVERPMIKYSASGNYFITRLRKDELRIYKVNKTKIEEINHARHRQGQVNHFVTDIDEKYLVCIGDGDSAISIVNLADGQYLRKLATPYMIGNMSLLLEAKSVAFNPSGNLMAVCFNNGQVVVYRAGSWSKVFENIVPGGLGIAKGAFVNFSKDGKQLIVNGNDGLKVYNTETFDMFSSARMNSSGRPLPLDSPSDYLVSVSQKEIQFEGIDAKQIKSYPIPDARLISSVGSNKSGYVGITFRTGEFKIFDPATGIDVITMVGQNGNSIFKTENNFYKVDKQGYDLVTFRVGKEAYPFEQFDAKYNRPDKVLKALYSNDETLVQLYEKAHEKRLKKLGLQESDLTNLLELPVVSILNRKDLAVTTNDEKINVSFEGIDQKGQMKSYNILHNNVPLYGRLGKPVSDNSKFSVNEEIELVHGSNDIQIVVTNKNGNESLKENLEVECTKEFEQNLFIVSIGTSLYKNTKYNLNYAAKDANDLRALYQGKTDQVFKSIHQKSLTNKLVKKEQVKQLKEFLASASKHDVVIFFIAGHGVLDDQFDYYYGTHDIDFNNPAKRGLKYEDLEAILDGIKPLKKILIMDTCHSGEVDKDDVVATNESAPSEEGEISFRAVGPAVKDDKKASPTKMMKELFVDLRKGTGTTVVSSAGGVEYAMESDEWKNGLFTYCMLNGLKNKTADINQDGKIMLSELQHYLKTKVSDLSHGKQVPTTRIENLNLDYQVW